MGSAPGDIDVPARYFVEQFVLESRKKVIGYTSRALEAMRRHAWPVNTRALINRVCRAIVMCDGHWITPRDLDLEQAAAAQVSAARPVFPLFPPRQPAQPQPA